jgi:hypothetical protein
MRSDDASKTREKTENKESKEAKIEVSNALFLVQTNEETKDVKGTHVNFAAKEVKEQTEISTNQPKAQPDQSPATNNTDADE